MKYPTLTELEGHADPHRPGGELRSTGTYWRDNRAPGTGPRSNPLSCGGCWCGGPMNHDWEGKAEGAPHPR